MRPPLKIDEREGGVGRGWAGLRLPEERPVVMRSVVAGDEHRQADDGEPEPAPHRDGGHRALDEKGDDAEAGADQVDVEDAEHSSVYEDSLRRVSV